MEYGSIMRARRDRWRQNNKADTPMLRQKTNAALAITTIIPSDMDSVNKGGAVAEGDSDSVGGDDGGGIAGHFEATSHPILTAPAV